MLKRFDRYILREIFAPFVIGLLLTAFVLLMNQVLLLAELFIDKGVPAGVVLRIFGLLVPSLLAFAVPMAVLVGVLGGLARLSADSETLAFQTLGVGRWRFLRPFLVFGFAAWLAASALALVLAPRANFLWVKTMTGSVLARVQLRINPLQFNQSIPDTVLFIQNVKEDGTWENVFVYLAKDPGNPRVITAARGRIHLYPETKRATLELADGVVHSGGLQDPGAYSLTAFARLEEEIDVENLFPPLTSEKRVREKDIAELIRDVPLLQMKLGDPGALPGAAAAARVRHASVLRDIRSHWVEIHKKFALPLVCILFVLVGLPLGLMAGRAGRTMGFALSLGVILLYYVGLTAGEKLAMDGRMPPWLGMWGPDMVVAAAAVILFLKSGRGQTGAPSRPRWKPARMASGRPSVPRLRSSQFVLPPLRFPNVLDRYVLRKSLTIMGFVFSGLTAAAVVVMFLEKLDVAREHGKPPGLLLEYVGLKLPGLMSALLPVAVLTSTLLALGLLAKTNEVTAAKASGISVYRLVLPILILGAVVSGAAFLIQERLAPAADIKAEQTWRRITDLPPQSYTYLNRHWVLGAGQDRIYNYAYFDPTSSSFSRLQVFEFDETRRSLARRVFAERAVLGAGRMILRGGWVREFAEGGAPPRPFVEEELPVSEGKGYFIRENKDPAQMTYRELKAYAADVRRMGFDARRLLVDLAGKASFPLVGLIMTVLAIPFSFAMGRKGTLVGVGLSIVIAMVFWGTFGVFRSLGYSGVLTPFLAAWGADLIFGLGGVVLFFRLRT